MLSSLAWVGVQNDLASAPAGDSMHWGWKSLRTGCYYEVTVRDVDDVVAVAHEHRRTSTSGLDPRSPARSMVTLISRPCMLRLDAASAAWDDVWWTSDVRL